MIFFKKPILNYALATGTALATLVGCARQIKTTGEAPVQDSIVVVTVPDTVQRADAPTPELEKQLQQNLEQAEAIMDAMTLTPSLETKPDGILFKLDARRNRTRGKEWMPSSENFRVTIVSAKGGEIWNSSAGKNYMTVVGDVKPSRPGTTEHYEMLWPGTNNNGQPVPPGTYTAQLIIPARPLPYSATVEFEWEGKK